MAPSRRRRVDGVARGAESTSSAKRAKVDEAKEEEDPLVRRKEEVVRLLGRARKGKGNARAKKELLTLCAKLEAKNEKRFSRLLPELWQKILDEYLHQNDQLAFAMTCRFFREKQKDLGKKVVTNLNAFHLLDLQERGKVTSHSLGWVQWVCDTFEVMPGFESSWCARVKGAVYEGDLVNYAAFQGSVEILRWLMEEKGWELNRHTGWWAGHGGSVEILEYLRERGYEFDGDACTGAASEGHLEALKFLRGLDPPCRWDELTAEASVGHLDVLKWARSQDPPCPWGAWVCAVAASYGLLDVLKWLRAQKPHCPWSRSQCRLEASGHHQHVIDWIDQQEDDSDTENGIQE